MLHTNAIPIRTDLVRRIAPALFAAALVAPSVVWISLDRSIWPWDPAWYGEVSVDLWATLRHGGNWSGLMEIQGTCKNFRIDHCKFKDADHMLVINGDTYGLVDHCRFEAHESHGGNVQPVDFSGPGGASYRKPLSLGTDQAMFFEDNEVYIAQSAGAKGRRSGNNPWIAPNHCARIVVRYNRIVNAELEIYGPGRNGQYACQQCEIYENQFSVDDNTPYPREQV